MDCCIKYVKLNAQQWEKNTCILEPFNFQNIAQKIYENDLGKEWCLYRHTTLLNFDLADMEM